MRVGHIDTDTLYIFTTRVNDTRLTFIIISYFIGERAMKAVQQAHGVMLPRKGHWEFWVMELGI